jgi:hypothetical protein
LENALFQYAPPGRQAGVATFLEGLAVAELSYLAQFLGSCILTTSVVEIDTWTVVRNRAASVYRKLSRLDPVDREHVEHKLILVTEFANRCGHSVSSSAREWPG